MTLCVFGTAKHGDAGSSTLLGTYSI